MFKLDQGLLAKNQPQKPPTKPSNKGILNLSKTKLTEDQTTALSKGLKFIPAPRKVLRQALHSSIAKFDRRIRISYFFASEETQVRKRFKLPSDWIPPYTPKVIAQKLKELHKQVDEINLKIPRANLSAPLKKGLKDLKDNPDIVIKPADKGSGTVIMDKDVYILEAERQFSNTKHYKSLDQPIYPQTAQKITEILEDLLQKQKIDQDCFDYLVPPDDAKPRRFYLLPKIHKEKDKWTIPDRMPPGRPIVSDCGSESYAISEYIDHFLAPLATTHESYLKDTPHFLETISAIEIPQDALLISMDVDALYTNIDNTDGLNAVRTAFQQNPDPERPDNAVLELLKLSLENNDFQFNDKCYLQTWGTAMGKKFAPNYANLFMAQWERGALAKCPLKPLVYKRYLDDIFVIWTHGRQAFLEFHQILNSHHESIKLKYEIHEQEIDFLDTTPYKGERFRKSGRLDTRVYFKPTDSLQLLDKYSYHPKHTYRGLIKSQILRYKRICNNDHDVEVACSKLFKALKSRHYSRRFLREIKAKTLHPQENLADGKSERCGHNRCHVCPYVTPTTTVQKAVPTGQRVTLPLTTTQNCNSSNGVYLLGCSQCGKAYVGETGNSFKVRITQHLSDIKLRKNTPVAEHFALMDEEDNCSLSDLQVIFLETLETQPEQYKNKSRRLDRERFWSLQLHTAAPKGLNTLPKPNEEPVLPLVIPFSETAVKVSQMARDTFDQLKAIYPTAFPHRFIPAYSRNQNISDQLVRATLPQRNKEGEEPIKAPSTPPQKLTEQPINPRGRGAFLTAIWGPTSPVPGDRLWLTPPTDTPPQTCDMGPWEPLPVTTGLKGLTPATEQTLTGTNLPPTDVPTMAVGPTSPQPEQPIWLHPPPGENPYGNPEGITPLQPPGSSDVQSLNPVTQPPRITIAIPRCMTIQVVDLTKDN